MCGTPIDSQLAEHRALLDEYREIESNEERLQWLIERTPIHAPVALEFITPERRVPGCMSGLWLHGFVKNDICHFSAKSDSDLVQGVVSFICDLYSGRRPEDVLQIKDEPLSILALDRLLTPTRRRAISNTVSFIFSTAANAHDQICRRA